MLHRVRQEADWDLVVVGGGATGLGTAVDAAARGYRTLLLEQWDFAKGTSSRSTKLVHGGVRYLQQGNVSLVMESLKERGILRKNAPHLVHDLPFVVPSYDWWSTPFYGIGMRVYDVLAGRYGFGGSRTLNKEETVEALPTIETKGLRGGVRYHDGQFDDARLAINLATTAAEQGACLLNYAQVSGLEKEDGIIVSGVRFQDRESGETFRVQAKVVINATGAWSDGLRRLDEPKAPQMIRPSQGVHLVLDRSFLPGESAIMVPQTKDGRVLFAIPWHDSVVVGTTDTPIHEIPFEPRARPEEIDFILDHAQAYLAKGPKRTDVKSVFAGIRPLVSAGDGSTASISRDHTLHVGDSGLVTIAGGKWTTYRKMAEDVVDHATVIGGLPALACGTEKLAIHGARAPSSGRLWYYGSDEDSVRELMAQGHGARVHEALALTEAEVIFAVRREMARTVEDVLARRSRALLFDAKASKEAAPAVGRVMAIELGRDQSWVDEQVLRYGAIADLHSL
ncbi:MAG: glycerol-3-phosphate dehydrogenase/oxidase [Myxococcota bacterium]